MYFTKGRRRRYERLMQTRPGVDHDEPLDDEMEKPHKSKRRSHETGQSKQGNNNYPEKEN